MCPRLAGATAKTHGSGREGDQNQNLLSLFAESHDDYLPEILIRSQPLSTLEAPQPGECSGRPPSLQHFS